MTPRLVVPLFLFTLLVIYNLQYCTIRRVVKGLKDSDKAINTIYYQKRPETAHIDCARVVSNDINYIKNLNRVPLAKAKKRFDCLSIRNRILPKLPMRPINISVAFIKVVFKDYDYIEDQLRATFHIENRYCFSVDRKAHRLLFVKLKAIEACLPNVIVDEKRFVLDSQGRNMNSATLSCLNRLQSDQRWNYALVMQNHEAVIKTPYELSDIYQALNGVSDVSYAPIYKGRTNLNYEYTAKGLRLFQNEVFVAEEVLNSTMKLATGTVSVSLARATADWILHSLNLTMLIESFNSMPYAVDEQLFPSLYMSDALDMPGRFTKRCINVGHQFISRIAYWGKRATCNTNELRHNVCILGLEDLHDFAISEFLVVNKFWPEFDYAGVDCLHELMYNRTFLGQHSPVNLDYYRNLPHVRYNNARKSNDKNYKLICNNNETYHPLVEAKPSETSTELSF